MLLGKVGLFAPRQALTKLFRHFDHNLDEKLDYRDFIEKLSGELSLRRENIIGQVWDKLASGADSIPVKLVIGAYSAEKNPRVLSGEKTAQQVFREFVSNFENAGNVRLRPPCPTTTTTSAPTWNYRGALQRTAPT
jgi:hypothetical protein